MRALLLASLALAGLGAAACTEKGAGPTDPSQAAQTTPDGQAAPATPPGPAAVSGQINWDAARADLAKRPASVQGVTVQSAGKDGPVPVPMLLPSGVVSAQSADRPTPPVVTDDGYFATYHLPKYDAVVNGSNKAYQTGAAPAAGDKEAMKFQTGEASASLSFSRYGASYTIDFECREVDGGDSCITEAEAKEFAESLFVAATQ